MQEELIIAGFGGQGILSMGRLIAAAGLMEGREVSWLPAYGPEMRGGTANCHVVVSGDPVGSPILNQCNSLIVMNEPSLSKFVDWVYPGGVVIADTDLVETESLNREDLRYFRIPATRMASEMGNLTFAGIILLGKLLKETSVVTEDNFEKALFEILPEKYHKLIPAEMDALRKGMNA